MYRQHFKLIAEALKTSRPYDSDGPAYEQWLRCVNEVMVACATCNPKFKRDTFLEACGV